VEFVSLTDITSALGSCSQQIRGAGAAFAHEHDTSLQSANRFVKNVRAKRDLRAFEGGAFGQARPYGQRSRPHRLHGETPAWTRRRFPALLEPGREL